MPVCPRMLGPIAVTVILMPAVIGCKETQDNRENQSLAGLAQQQLTRQAEQMRQMSQLQQQVAEGARRLVEADAQARQELVGMQRELQSQRAEVDRQRDLLEAERRQLAARRRLDPIIAAAIGRVGLLVACLLPLVLCWHLLRQSVQPADDAAVARVLLEDLVAARPVLLVRRSSGDGPGMEGDPSRPGLPEAANRTDEPR